MRTGCGAADRSSRTCFMERRLDDLVVAQERFEDLQQLGRIPFRCPFDPSEYPAFLINQEAGWQTLNLEGPLHSTLWILIDLSPSLSIKGSTAFLPPWSSDIATTAILSPSRDCTRSSDGISRKQGSHQVAQRLTRTILPANSERLTVFPARSTNEIAGAGSSGEAGMNSPSRARCGTPELSSAAKPPPAKMSRSNEAKARLHLKVLLFRFCLDRSA